MFSGEMSVIYLFTRYKFNWSEVEFSFFSTYAMLTSLVGKIFCMFDNLGNFHWYVSTPFVFASWFVQPSAPPTKTTWNTKNYIFQYVKSPNQPSFLFYLIFKDNTIFSFSLLNLNCFIYFSLFLLISSSRNPPPCQIDFFMIVSSKFQILISFKEHSSLSASSHITCKSMTQLLAFLVRWVK